MKTHLYSSSLLLTGVYWYQYGLVINLISNSGIAALLVIWMYQIKSNLIVLFPGKCASLLAPLSRFINEFGAMQIFICICIL